MSKSEIRKAARSLQRKIGSLTDTVQLKEVDGGYMLTGLESAAIEVPFKVMWFKRPSDRAHLKKAFEELAQIPDCDWAQEWAREWVD